MAPTLRTVVRRMPLGSACSPGGTPRPAGALGGGQRAGGSRPRSWRAASWCSPRACAWTPTTPGRTSPGWSARGVAGLGFGVGLGHEEIPAALVDGGRAAGLPLMEVPRDTPFVAIGKAGQRAARRRAVRRDQPRLRRPGPADPRRPPPRGPARGDRPAGQGDRRLGAPARRGGEPYGTPPPAPRPTRRRRARPARSPELGAAEGQRRRRASGRRSRRAWRSPGRTSTSSCSRWAGPRPRGFFAVGAARPFSPVAHTVVNAAGSLLTLALEQGGDQLEAERRVRSAVLRLLLAGARCGGGGAGGARRRSAGGCPGAGRGAGRSAEATRRSKPPARRLRRPPGPTPTRPTAELALGTTVRSGRASVVVRVRHEARRCRRSPGRPVGIELARCDGELRGGLDQAGRALAAADAGLPVMRFAELAGQGLLAPARPGRRRGVRRGAARPAAASTARGPT